MSTMTNFRAEDMPSAKKSAGAVDAPKSESKDKDKSTEVPSGSAAEVTKWVDGDKNRAQAALDAEKSGSSPRKGLVAELEGLLSK